MNSDQKYWICFFTIIVSGIVIIACAAIIFSSINRKRFIDNGYSQTTVIGSSRMVWQKVK